MATGCIGSRVTDKQPIACGVDTVNADIGTVFTLTFAVHNSAGQGATVQRVVTVISPCDDGQFFCGTSCSEVDCETQASVASLPGASPAAVAEPPQLVMLPTITSSQPTWAGVATLTRSASINSTLYLVYNEPSPVSLSPCASLSAANISSAPLCAAAAFDNATGSDLSGLITVQDVSSVPGQVKCTDITLTLGTCLPGQYTLQYTAGNSDGLSASGFLFVLVEQRTFVILNYMFSPPNR